MSEEPTRRTVNKEVWGAVGVIVAALITGVVTLLIHVLPSGDSSQGPPATSTATAPSTTTSTSTAAANVTKTVAAMVGKWQGTARDTTGAVFPIAVEITAPCTLEQRCGSIGVPQVPCYGQIFLAGVQDDEVEFRVANFTSNSNRDTCRPGAGEHFRLRPDGRLAYRTTYEPIAQGTLERQ